MTSFAQQLRDPATWGHPGEPVEFFETHISWVALVGELAFKVKKPVDLGFVDFSTRQRRHTFCEEELRLNRRLAPELYLAVVPLFESAGRLSLEGQGEPVDYAVQMRRFPQAALLANAMETRILQPRHWDQFSVELARFHAAAATASTDSPYGTPQAVLAPALANLDRLRDVLSADQFSPLQAWTNAEYQRLQPLFEERRSQGWIRECHGDLHLGNLLLREDRIVPFDCLEFSPELRWIDVTSELAFLAMDLMERGHPAPAWRVLNGWLDATGDYAGLRTWRWYSVYRALVRAKVAALRRQQLPTGPEADAASVDVGKYVTTALRTIAPARPGLILTRGWSGSGKSVLAGQLAERLGGIRIRSDVERKRRFGLWGEPVVALETGDPYSKPATQRLYGKVLPELARSVLDSGLTVLLDATFLRRADRIRFRELADGLSVPFAMLDVRISPDMARGRIEARRKQSDDPSDATPDILARQQAHDEPLTGAECAHALAVDGSRYDIETLVQQLADKGIAAARTERDHT